MMPFEGTVHADSPRAPSGDVVLWVRLLDQNRVLAQHLETVRFTIKADGRIMTIAPNGAELFGVKRIRGTFATLMTKAPEMALVSQASAESGGELTLEITRLEPGDRVMVVLVDMKEGPANSITGRAVAIGCGTHAFDDSNAWYLKRAMRPEGREREPARRAGAREQFVGKVVGEGTVLHNVTLALSRHEQRASTVICSFLVEVKDGQRIQVHTNEQTVIGPDQTRKGRWREIGDEPLGAPFSDSAPGGHVKVQLAGWTVAAGDTITIAGVVEQPSKATGIRAVHAELIGVGAQAVEWLEARSGATRDQQSDAKADRAQQQEERKLNRTDGRELSILAAAVVLFGGLASLGWGLVLSATAGERPWPRVALALGLMFAGLGVYLWRRRRFTPRMNHGDWQSGGVLWSVRPWASHLMGWGVPATMLIILGGLYEAAYAVPMLVLLVEGLVLSRESRKHARGLRTIHSSADVDGDGWGARTGTVVDGELERRLAHTLETSTHKTTSQVETTTGGLVNVNDTTTITDYGSTGSGGTGSLKVQIGDRVIDVVVTTAARWASTRRYIEGLTLTELVRPGDALIVVGRIEGDRMEATGPESLFMFGSHRGPPKVALRRALVGHWLGMLGFAALIAAAIVLTIKEIIAP